MNPAAVFPGWRDWLFSAKAFAASMLALYIGLAAGLPRPYWAMAAVYVVANPLAGATRSKAIYRALGTLLGALGSILLVPLFVDAPELFCLVVALWTAGFLFVSLLDPTPRSYLFMLAGYTLPLIALPTVSAPDTIFDVAVARAQEITIGIVCASLINSLVFPVRVGPLLGKNTQAWMRDAGTWAGAILRREHGSGVTLERARLAADIRVFDTLIEQLAFDTPVRAIVQLARDLRGRLAMLLPLLSSLDDRLNAGEMTGETPAELRRAMDAIVAWINSADVAGDEAAERLRANLRDLEPHGPSSTEWPGLVLSSALERMSEFVDLWQDCRDLRRALALGEAAGRSRPVLHYQRAVTQARSRDLAILAFSAGSTFAATFAAGLLWVWSGWADGAGWVIMTAVGCSFFATLDNPVAQLRSFTVWMAVSVAVSALYLFAALPAISDFAMLVGVFAVPFLVFGTLVPRPQFTMMAMLMAVNTASFVALQGNYSADFASFFNSCLGSVAGGLFAIVWVSATRPFGAAFAARRLVRAGRSDIAATARGGRNETSRRFAGRIVDRLSQLVPRLALGVEDDGAAGDVLVELRIGLNILDLRSARSALPAPLRTQVDRVLDGVARQFADRHRAAAAKAGSADDLLVTIDEAIASFAAARLGRLGRPALQALVGMRRALYPADCAPAHVDTPPEALAMAAE